MKKGYDILIVSIICIVSFYFVFNRIKTGDTRALMGKRKIELISDTLREMKYENNYLKKLIWVSSTENTEVDLKKVKVYRLSDGKPNNPVSFNNIFTTNKNKIILRYAEIGCNSCADSTIKILKRIKSIQQKYEVCAIVDFTEYDSYLKWRKIIDVDFPIWWVEKGKLPYNAESLNETYIFKVDTKLQSYDFFVPSSGYPYYIRQYFGVM